VIVSATTAGNRLKRFLVDCNSEITSSRPVLGPKGPAFNSPTRKGEVMGS